MGQHAAERDDVHAGEVETSLLLDAAVRAAVTYIDESFAFLERARNGAVVVS